MAHGKLEEDPFESALAALVVTLICVLMVDTIEQTRPLQFARKTTWDWLVSGLDGQVDQVAVVDISAIRRAPNAAGQLVTDRTELRAVVEALRRAGARGIAIDIDFSPEHGLPVDNADPEFLAWLTTLRDEAGRPVRVHVGVHRNRTGPRDAWLGSADLAPLAATLLADTSDNRLMPIDVTWRGAEPLPGLGAAAAGLAAGSLPPSPCPAGLASCWREREVAGALLRSFFVDYSCLPDLLDARLPSASRDRVLVPGELVPAITAELQDAPGRVRDKVVIVGFGDPAGMADNGFVAPGFLRALPGVYSHAAASATLLGPGCLHAPTPLFEKVLDLGLAMALLGLVLIVRTRLLRRCSEVEELALHVLLTAGTIAVLWLGIGPGLVHAFRLVPDGLLVVTLALLAEVLWQPALVLLAALGGRLTSHPLP